MTMPSASMTSRLLDWMIGTCIKSSEISFVISCVTKLYQYLYRGCLQDLTCAKIMELLLDLFVVQLRAEQSNR